jgi:hypothetical protein
MKEYPFDKNLSNELEVLDFFEAAIRYREDHKAQSSEIAVHVFDKAHPKPQLSFPIADDIDNLRNEFGALEAPGMPEDDDKDPDEYDDELWTRLNNLVTKAKEKRTV